MGPAEVRFSIAAESPEPARRGALHEAVAREQAADARAELLQSHMGMAHHLACRFSAPGPPDDDLVQVASLGLLKAIDSFEPDRGVAFSTYGWLTVLGEVKHYLRDQGWAVRVPRRSKDLRWHLSRAAEELRQRFGRSPTVAELAQDVGVGGRELVEALEVGRCRRSVSIERLEHDDYTSGIVAAAEAGFDATESRDLLASLLARLPWRERQAIRLRYVEELSQAEIGKRLGISQMHVSRILTRSLDRLRMWARVQETETA